MNKSFRFLLAILGIITLIGFVSGMRVLFSGKDLFGTSNEVPWGFLISAYVFFVSSIGCCFVGSLGSVFKIAKYKLIERRAIFLAIVIVLVGMAIIFVELGKPFRMFTGYITGPNLSSPIWWMGVNYTLYLIFIFAEFISILKNNLKLTQTFGVFAFLFAVAAHSTVGSVFGIVNVRPFWYGPYMPIDFILYAWILGFSLMIIVSFLINKFTGKAESEQLIRDMGKWLAVALSINMFFTFWEIRMGLSSGEGDKYLTTIVLLKGPLSLRFLGLEVIAGTIIPFILLIVPRWKTISSIFLASLLAVFGMFVDKMNMVQAGQIIPLAIKRNDIFNYVKYFPTSTEISIVSGAIAFVILFYVLAEKYYFSKVKRLSDNPLL